MARATTTPTTAAPPSAAAKAVRASAYVWVVLFASSLVQTTASFGNQAISPLAPFLLPDLGLNKSQLGLVLTAFYVGGIAIMTAAGWASDRLGVRRMFLAGLLGWRGALASNGWFTAGTGLLAWLLCREQGEAHAGRARGPAQGDGFR